MIIKVLGSGCSKCQSLDYNLPTKNSRLYFTHSQSLEKETINALAELNVAADVQKVTKMDEIMQYDVMMTPALVIDEKVKSAGKVLTVEEIKAMIKQEL